MGGDKGGVAWGVACAACLGACAGDAARVEHRPTPDGAVDGGHWTSGASASVGKDAGRIEASVATTTMDASVSTSEDRWLDAASAPAIDNGAASADAAVELVFDAELRARREFWATPIVLQGRVMTQTGKPVASAIVRLRDRETTTASDGTFALERLRRSNGLLQIDAAQYKSEVVVVHLARPTSEANVLLDATVLVRDEANIVRFLFAGDTSFGRRFLDPKEQAAHLEIPPSNSKALIDAADPEPGSRATLSFVAPMFQAAEFPIVNLETPVTGTPSEYHMNKDYVFFSLPESLAVFPDLGVRYVNLGNNHVFDYLADGVVDTLQNLADFGIASSGAGINVADAFAPHRETLGDSDYSFFSATSVTGAGNPPLYVAAIEESGEKGGAADLSDTERVVATIQGEREAGYFPIVQEHTGAEYTYWPTDYARERMSLAVQSGAALVVSHHPHVAQGFAFEDGHLIIEGLGNLCFDQARHETMLGLITTVDLRGESVVEARAMPIYLEDFRPRPIGGALSRLLLRRIAERSENASLAIENSWAHVVEGAAELDSRAVELALEVPLSGQAIVDLRAVLLEGESLQRAKFDAKIGVQAGEDLLLYGDFEDWDSDDEHFELPRWDVSGPSSYPCLVQPHWGAAALCSYRTRNSSSVSAIAFRNRVRVLGEAIEEPAKDLSLVGYARAENAGAVQIEVRYYASEGSKEFGSEVAFDSAGGSFDWEWFEQDLSVPPDATSGDLTLNSAHAMRLFITHAPPEAGDGVASFDDLAIVSWRPVAASNATELDLAAMNPIQFLRVSGLPGKYTLKLDVARAPARQ